MAKTNGKKKKAKGAPSADSAKAEELRHGDRQWADRTMGPEMARTFYKSPHKGLGNKTPAEVSKDGLEGAQRVHTLLIKSTRDLVG